MGKVEMKIGIDADLLAKAEASGVSVEAFLDSELRHALAGAGRIAARAAAQAGDPVGAEERARQWAKDSAETIRAHNNFVEEHGEFGKEWRSW